MSGVQVQMAGDNITITGTGADAQEVMRLIRMEQGRKARQTREALEGTEL